MFVGLVWHITSDRRWCYPFTFPSFYRGCYGKAGYTLLFTPCYLELDHVLALLRSCLVHKKMYLCIYPSYLLEGMELGWGDQTTGCL